MSWITFEDIKEPTNTPATELPKESNVTSTEKQGEASDVNTSESVVDISPIYSPELGAPSKKRVRFVDIEALTDIPATELPGDDSSAEKYNGASDAGSLITENSYEESPNFYLNTVPANAEGLCTLCLQGCERQCSKCKTAYYCSMSCMVIDLHCHSMVCMDIGESQLIQNRPKRSWNYGLGFYFPPDDSDVEYIYYSRKQIAAVMSGVKFVGKGVSPKQEDLEDDKTEAIDFIGKGYWWIKAININFRLMRHIENNRSIIIFCDTNFMTPVGVDNPVLVEATRRYGVADVYPRGGCYVIPGPKSDTEKHGRVIPLETIFKSRVANWEEDLDIKPSDFRHVVDYFLYRDRFCHQPMAKEGTMWATALLCIGDDNTITLKHKFNSKPEGTKINKKWGPGVPIRVAANDPVFKGTLCPLSKHIGIPIRLQRRQPNPKLPGAPGMMNVQLFNPYAATLMVVIDIDDPNWGNFPTPRSPNPWASFETGNVLVAREDRGFVGDFPMILVQWYYTELDPLFGKAQKEGTKAARKQAMKCVTLQNFEAFRQSLDVEWEYIPEEGDVDSKSEQDNSKSEEGNTKTKAVAPVITIASTSKVVAPASGVIDLALKVVTLASMAVDLFKVLTFYKTYRPSKAITSTPKTIASSSEAFAPAFGAATRTSKTIASTSTPARRRKGFIRIMSVRVIRNRVVTVIRAKARASSSKAMASSSKVVVPASGVVASTSKTVAPALT